MGKDISYYIVCYFGVLFVSTVTASAGKTKMRNKISIAQEEILVNNKTE